MGVTPRYLVVEDDRLFARSLVRFFGRFGEVEVVETVAEALRALHGGEVPAGITIDVDLPDGEGLEVLSFLRGEGLDIPVLVLTGRRDERVIHTAQLHGATYLCKPVAPDNLRAFLELCERGYDESARLQRVISILGEAHGLAERERQVLLLAAAGMSREKIAEELGVGVNSVRTYARRVLEKTESPSWRDLVRSVHSRVFRLSPAFTKKLRTRRRRRASH